MLNHLKHIGPIFFWAAIFIYALDYSEYFGREVDVGDILYVSLAIFIFSIDSVLLHIKYMYVSRGERYSINDGDTAIITIEGRDILLTKDNILSIELHLPPSVYDGTFGWGNGENYSYMKIFDASGGQYIVTSLMNSKLELPQSFVPKVKKIRRWRCWPK